MSYMFSDILADANWVPLNTFSDDEGTIVEWWHVGDTRFDAPFFDDTAHAIRAARAGNARVRRIPLQALSDCPAFNDTLPPSGFVFHMSRCGSTLVSQMLAACTSNIVIAEAPPIDAAIRAQAAAAPVPPATRSLWIRRMIQALGRRRFGNEKNYFIKFDSWHMLYMDRIREAFPDVPWIFLYRQPMDVLRSHTRMPGYQMVPGVLDAADLGLDEEPLAPGDLRGYMVAVLRAICEAASRNYRPDQARLVNYAALPEAFFEQVTKLFGTDFNADELSAMEARAAFDSKSGYKPFQPDDEPLVLPEELPDLVEEKLMPLYRRLERDSVSDSD